MDHIIIQCSKFIFMEFTKNLSPSEAKYKYLGLPKKIRTEFPPKDEIFQVEFKTRSYKMKVNNRNSNDSFVESLCTLHEVIRLYACSLIFVITLYCLIMYVTFCFF